MFSFSRIISTLVAILISSAFALPLHAQQLLPGKDVQTAREETAGRYAFTELAGASRAISSDAYGLFFNPPRSESEWAMQTQNYRLLLALSLQENDRGVATLLAAAAAMNAGRDDHATALALEARSELVEEDDKALASAILDQLSGRTKRGYSNAARDRIWQLSRQVGVFGPFASTAEQEGDYTRLCLQFSRPVQASHRVDYRDLVTVTPTPPVQRFVVLKNGYQLCVVGAEFEQTYTMTVQAGLLSTDGDRLRETTRFSQATPGRKAEMRLPDQGYVLPASGAQLVPIETVNIEELDVGFYHLDERNITQVLNRGVLARDTYSIAGARNAYEYVNERSGTFHDKVSPVFEGTLSINALKHQRRRDGISISQMLDGPAQRGLYLLTVHKPGSDAADAIKWIMVSDLALTTVDTPQGLFINAIDTRTGTPVIDDVAVQLVTRGNRTLEPFSTEAATAGFFNAAQLRGKNADEPLYLYASHPTLGDAFLALGRAPIEIATDVGLSTLESDALELWAKADRGTYREGEVARVVGLLRQTDPAADVLTPKTLLARVIDPNGDVIESYDISLAQGLGFETEVTLPFGARQGRWSLDLTLGRGMPVLKSVSLRVADFVPPSVEIKIDPVSALKFDGSDTVDVRVDYLYGAPAKDLQVTLTGMLSREAKLGGYDVGLSQEEFVLTRPFNLTLDTDAEGRASFDIPAFALPDQTALSMVTINAIVTDAAGREERIATRAAIDSDQILIGLKPEFDIEYPVAENSTVRFSAAALTSGGEITSGDATWILYREIYDYNWYFDGGRWNYESSYIDLPVSEGMLSLDGETILALNVDWGAYRVELVSDDGRSATSLRFDAGWRARPQVDRAPSRLGVTVSSADPRPGDVIDLVIDSPHAGSGLAYLVGSKTSVIDLGAFESGVNTLSLTIPSDWNDVEGLWILPVVYSTGAIGVDQLPSRAVGAHFVGFDQSPVLLDVSTRTEAEIRPRETLTVPVSVGGLQDDESGFVLAWIVDDGVLQMTNYQSPNPAAHFLAPYALPADLRDTFASLIASAGLSAAPLQQGYDGAFAMAMRATSADLAEFSLAQGLTTRIKETLALSSTIVPLSPQGSAALTFDLPDFVGRGRLMTMAWTDQGRMGAASDMLVIRDPVVADLFLPRFLAPGDEVDVKLLLSNTQDRELSATVHLNPESGLTLAQGVESMSLTLDAKGQQTIPLRIKAEGALGATSVEVTVMLEDETLSRSFPIEVRAIAPRDIIRDAFIVEAGESLTLDPSLLADLHDPTIEMSVTPLNQINANFLAQSLANYPYRCSEQTTSRATGLLLGQSIKMSDERRNRELNDAFVTLQNRQGYSGLISLWPNGSSGDMFLHAYASDLLGLAADRGYEAAATVRGTFIQNLKRNLARVADPYYAISITPRAEAYSLAVLARAGEANIAAQRLLFDQLLELEGHVMAKAALAVAAEAVGDKSDRDALLDALNAPAMSDAPNVLEDYGTSLRDQLAALALLAEGGLLDHPAVETYLTVHLPLVALALQDNWLTTQEEAWALRLAQHLGQGDVAFAGLGGLEGTVTAQQSLEPADFDGAKGVLNTGSSPVLVSLWQAGTPSGPTSVTSKGVTLQRLMHDLDTLQPVENPAPGQRVLVSLVGTVFEDTMLDYVLADLLPAGFEVEQTSLPATVLIAGGSVGNCQTGEQTLVAGICLLDGQKAFQQTGTEYAEARADRVIFGFEGQKEHFALHYVMRRTQAGHVSQPGAYVEAMYVPETRARSASTQLR